MTPNVGDMIESFHKLCDKIEANHVRMNSIQDTCHHVVQNVYQTNEYRKKLEELTSQPRKQNRKSLIAQIKMEQRYSGALFTENSELKIAIQTHRKALDEIMGKYREQMKLLKRIKELEEYHKNRLINDDSLENRRSYLNDVKLDLPAVISEACDKDFELIQKQQILIEKIKEENAKMRRALMYIGDD